MANNVLITPASKLIELQDGSNSAIPISVEKSTLKISGQRVGTLDGNKVTTLLGYNALSSSASNVYSVAIGSALKNNTTGKYNNAVGNYALFYNTIGIRNNAFGYGALYSNTIGIDNNAVGYGALYYNTTDKSNIGFGSRALYTNTIGFNNIAFGYGALYSNTTGNNNTAVGRGALYKNKTGNSNIGFGSQALYNNNASNEGNYNIGIGYFVLQYGYPLKSIAIGASAIANMSNTANLSDCTTFGYKSLYKNSTGVKNVAAGSYSLFNNTVGTTNTVFGYKAGYLVNSNTNNSMIGNIVSGSSNSVSNEITLGNSAVTSLRCQVTSITALSDFRDKTDIQNFSVGIDFIKKLRPVTFKWDKREWYTDGQRDGSKTENKLQVGFIAQELKQLQEEFDASYLNLVYESNPNKLEANPQNLLTPLIKAVQEQQNKIENLVEKLNILKNKLSN